MQFHRNLTTVCLVFLTILSLALPQLTVASANFSQNLQLRDTGDDVARLQQFLNAEHFLIAQSGPGSSGNETTTFGLLTYQALTQFQSAHGLPATGFFGPLTRALIATLVASSNATSTAAVPQSPTAPAFSTLSSTTSGYIPGVTPLPGYKPGQLIFIGGGASTPATPPAPTPAPTPYVAKAVHFDGSAFMSNAGLVAADSDVFSAAFFFRGIVEAPVPPYLMSNGTLMEFTNDNALSTINFVFYDDGHPFVPSIMVDLTDALDNNDYGVTGLTSLSDDVWHSAVYSGKTSAPARARLYIDGVDVTDAPTSASDFPMTFNGVPLLIGQANGYGTPNFSRNLEGDIANLWIAPGVSLLDGNGDIPVATLRKFVSATNKPVDLGTDCSTPTGSAPAVCLTGDSSSFVTNKGTGGSFTTTGILTDAVTSPSN